MTAPAGASGCVPQPRACRQTPPWLSPIPPPSSPVGSRTTALSIFRQRREAGAPCLRVGQGRRWDLNADPWKSPLCNVMAVPPHSFAFQ